MEEKDCRCSSTQIFKKLYRVEGLWCLSTQIFEKVYEGEGVCLPFYSDIEGMLWKRETVFALLIRYGENFMEEKECICPSTQIFEKLYGWEEVYFSDTQIFAKVYEGEKVCLHFYSDI